MSTDRHPSCTFAGCDFGPFPSGVRCVRCIPTEDAPEPTPQVLEVSLSDAAAWLVVLHSDPDLKASYRAALAMWELLVGLTGPEALAYAQTIAAARVTAYLPPL